MQQSASLPVFACLASAGFAASPAKAPGSAAAVFARSCIMPFEGSLARSGSPIGLRPAAQRGRGKHSRAGAAPKKKPLQPRFCAPCKGFLPLAAQSHRARFAAKQNCRQNWLPHKTGAFAPSFCMPILGRARSFLGMQGCGQFGMHPIMAHRFCSFGVPFSFPLCVPSALRGREGRLFYRNDRFSKLFDGPPSLVFPSVGSPDLPPAASGRSFAFAKTFAGASPSKTPLQPFERFSGINSQCF